MVFMIKGRKLKNMRARNMALGWALTRRTIVNVIP
jgi:hypothetical protein